MYFLDKFNDDRGNGAVSVSASQASDFAKNVADDFNPIHDADSKRFCVPGDLLFAIALRKYGIYETMNFHFLGLVGSDAILSYPHDLQKGEVAEVVNQNGKPVLELGFAGESINELSSAEQLIRNYVAFSGQNFPGILVPLMEQHAVMINPKRPLVIYQSMSLKLENLGFSQLDIELSKTTLSVNGKRGDAELHFVLSDGQKTIGSGIKKLVLSGLREYEPDAIEAMCAQYYASKEAWGG
jgi:hypothetical protein